MANLKAYVEELLGGEDPYLRQIREEAEREGIPQIQVPIELGRLLQILIVQANVKCILEIGALFGYSSILMARALPAGGKIVSLELSDKHAAIARKNIEGAGVGDSVEIRQGAAIGSLAAMQGETFDLVFIDADKVSYSQYLEHALRLTHPGSVIVADNAWRGGLVAEAGTDDESARAIAEFNKSFLANPHLLATIIPTRNCSDAAALGVVRSS